MLKKKDVIVFEDEHHGRFYPLCLSRPTFDLLAGTRRNIDRIYHHFRGFNIFTLCRPHLSALPTTGTPPDLDRIAQAENDTTILINGSAVIRKQDQAFIDELKTASGPAAYLNKNLVVAAVLPNKSVRDLLDRSGMTLSLYTRGSIERITEVSGNTQQSAVLIFSHIWDPINENSRLIQSDFDEFYSDRAGDIDTGDTHCYEKSALYVGEGFSGDAGVVIDARKGPVVIGDGVEIKPNTFLEGPAFVGNGCKLVGGKVTGGSAFGAGCRIGGEVETTIILGDTNKYHEGFIGHAYIGKWVNLGALTTNSDLANNYGNIKIKQNGVVVDTGEMKIGSFIGDHSKIGIGMTLNTGAVIGFSSNLFGGSLILEKEVPSFGWGNDALRSRVRLADAVRTAETVMARRNHEFTAHHARLFKKIFEDSQTLRNAWTKKQRFRKNREGGSEEKTN